MARLRREPQDDGDALPGRSQNIKTPEEEETTKAASTRRRKPARYIASDYSSAEESELPAKLVQKTKPTSKAPRSQVRLGVPKTHSQSNLSTSTLHIASDDEKLAKKKPATRKPRNPIVSRLKQKESEPSLPPQDMGPESNLSPFSLLSVQDKEHAGKKNIVPRIPRSPIISRLKQEKSEPSLPQNPEPELCEDEGEVDVEESIWCGSIDGSSSASEDELPSPRKLLNFPRKISDEAKKAAPSRKQPDLAKQLQAWAIFDDDDDDPVRPKERQPKTKDTKEIGRPGSSSDKENNAAIIRFSPPRLKSPQKKAPIERPVTPPAPASPSKSKLQSPSKRPPRIPTPPLRPSLDAFWTADAINDWNDQYSPQKPLKSPKKLNLNPNSEDASPTTSPRKTQSPTKRTKAEIQSRKDFDIRKITLAESFLQELDQVVAQGQIQALAASTGGVQLIWSKTLNSTAGRANWRRETTKTKSTNPSQPPTMAHKHFASIELASKVIDDEHRLLNVIAHEFCHLCNFMISGIKDQPHGKQFKIWGAKCSKAFGDRVVEVTTKHSYEIEYKYIWRCADEECGMEFKRHSKSIDPKRHRCGGCKNQLVQIKPVPRGGSGNGTPDGMGGKIETPVTGYAAFVKAHFATLKKSMPGASHKEVMEALGKKYRAEKAGRGPDDAAMDGIAKNLGAVKLKDRDVIELE